MIHDVIAERLPRHIFPTFGGRIRWRMKSMLGLAQADRILTVSEYSRRALTEQFGLPLESIAVVGEAPDPVFRRIDNTALPVGLRERGLAADGRLIIYVGGFGPHKNLPRLLDAFEAIVGERGYVDVTLLLVGDYEGDAFYSEYARLRRRVEQSKIRPRVVFTGFLPDEDLAALLNCSAFLVLPSLMEGYGLPAVEAAACGLPAMVTRNSPIPELLGDGALPVDPDRTVDLRQGMARLLDDPGLRRRMGEAARAAVATLTWETAARELLDVLEDAPTRR
jgi:glycosyltransferase involved in cell wall biosynthesis